MEIFALIKNIFSFLWSIISFLYHRKEKIEQIKTSWKNIVFFFNKYLNVVLWYKKVKYYEKQTEDFFYKYSRLLMYALIMYTSKHKDIYSYENLTPDEIADILINVLKYENNDSLPPIEYDDILELSPFLITYERHLKDIKDEENEMIKRLIKKYPELLSNPDAIDNLDLFNDCYYNDLCEKRITDISIAKRCVVRKSKFKNTRKLKRYKKKLKKKIRAYSAEHALE